MTILKLEILSCQNTGWATGFVECTAVHTEPRVCLNSPQFHQVPTSTVHRGDTEGTALTRKSFSNLCPYTTPPYQLSRRKGRNETDQSLYFLCSVPSTDNVNVQNHTFILPCAFPIQHPVQDQRFLGASLPTCSLLCCQSRSTPLSPPTTGLSNSPMSLHSEPKRKGKVGVKEQNS